jgi:hypothetical protein
MDKKLKPVPADNKGLGKLPTNVRNNMGYMAYGGKTKKKGYAYGSMVRSPMASENKMQTSMNPMQPRQQQGGIKPAMGMPGMMYGGKAKKKNGY